MAGSVVVSREIADRLRIEFPEDPCSASSHLQHDLPVASSSKVRGGSRTRAAPLPAVRPGETSVHEARSRHEERSPKWS